MDSATAPKIVRPLLAGLAAAGVAAGIAARLAGFGDWAGPIWAAVTLPVLLALLIEIVTSLRRGNVGLDIVAALSMSAALAVGENLAASIVALMYAGGQYLESFAEKAARREMTALLSRVPRSAIRHRDGQLEEVALELDPARGPPAGSARRCGACRWNGGRGRRGAGPVGTHRRVPSGAPQAR